MRQHAMLHSIKETTELACEYCVAPGVLMAPGVAKITDMSLIGTPRRRSTNVPRTVPVHQPQTKQRAPKSLDVRG